MKVYGDLAVRGSRAALDKFIAALEQHLTDGWTRHYAREAELPERLWAECTASPVRLRVSGLQVNCG